MKKPKDAVAEFQSFTDKKLKYAMTKLPKPKFDPKNKSLWQRIKEKI